MQQCWKTCGEKRGEKCVVYLLHFLINLFKLCTGFYQFVNNNKELRKIRGELNELFG